MCYRSSFFKIQNPYNSQRSTLLGYYEYLNLLILIYVFCLWTYTKKNVQTNKKAVKPFLDVRKYGKKHDICFLTLNFFFHSSFDIVFFMGFFHFEIERIIPVVSFDHSYMSNVKCEHKNKLRLFFVSFLFVLNLDCYINMWTWIWLIYSMLQTFFSYHLESSTCHLKVQFRKFFECLVCNRSFHITCFRTALFHNRCQKIFANFKLVLLE